MKLSLLLFCWSAVAVMGASDSVSYVDPLDRALPILRETEKASPDTYQLSTGAKPDDMIKTRVAGRQYSALQQFSLERPGVQLDHPVQSFDLTGGLRVWGGPWEKLGKFNRYHSPELLPCLFERTLELDNLPRVGSLDWVFTGPRAGVTVQIESGQVSVIARFYDSPTLVEMGHRDAGGRYPEWRTEPAVTQLAAPPKSVTVSMDHRQTLRVCVNGNEIFSRRFLPDLRRHQLQTDNENHISGRIVSPAEKAVTVRVDPARAHQTMLGFGGTTIPTAFAQLSEAGKARWWELIQEYNLLIQREYPNSRKLNKTMDNWDDLSLAIPHYYGDSFPNSEISDFNYIRKIRELGGMIVFEFWYPPSEDPKTYAGAMVKFCRDCESKTGAPPEICGVLNEWPHKAVFPQMWDFTLQLRGQLNEAGYQKVKIHMPDDGFVKEGTERARALIERPEVWSAIDFTATHEYDLEPLFPDPDKADPLLLNWKRTTQPKPFLANELTVLLRQNQAPDYRVAFCVAQLYHKNLTIADAVMLGYCWLLLNVEQPSFGWTRTLFVPDISNGGMPVASSHQLRVMGAYSRRIRRGMQRIAAAADDQDLLVTAFAEGNKRTLVAVNRSTRPVVMNLDWPGAALNVVETVDPYSPNAVGSSLPERLAIAPGAIVTLSNVPLLQSKP